MENKSLQQFQDEALRPLLALTTVSATVIGAAAFFAGEVFLAACASLLAMVPLGQAYARHSGGSRRIVLGIVFPLFAAIAVALTNGSQWQMDMHMLFFAYLAALALLADWRVIAVATGATATHHIALNVAAPELLFNAGADYARVALHAVIVLIEAAALVLLTSGIAKLIEGLARSREQQASLEEASAREQRVLVEEQAATLGILSEGLSELARGNFTHVIASQPGDTASRRELAEAFNTSLARLSDAFADVRETSTRVNTGADEIRAASDDLASRNEHQSASLEETAAAMRQVTALVKKTAESASRAQGAMTQTHSRAQDGGEVVSRAVEAMASIEKSASEITQIIDVIDGIAFQTNLLALNAGVEAARAGDAGKGFAVVANEVRALAQRSAEAARDIKQLIGTSTGRVNEGVALVGETGALLETIVDQVGAVTSQVEEIAAMATSQAGNLEQVNSSVETMDQMTQRNAAMVEQSTAAARSLAEEASRLEQLVNRFRTTNQRVPEAAPRRGSAIILPAKATKREPAQAAKPARIVPPVTGNLALRQDITAEPDEQDWSEF